jgi:hypothetical protein
LDFRERGEAILDDLLSVNSKLEGLGEAIVDTPTSKSNKQKLASSSYEIAKFIKEIIGLIGKSSFVCITI